MQKQAWAQNAVIISDNGFSIQYRPRCPKCGHVPTNLSSGGTAQEGVRAYHSATCEKCGEHFEIIISRG